MVTTHVVATRDPDGSLSAGQWLAGGRASALFALLAGVGLALATGGRVPVHGTERAARSAAIAVRALLVAVLGLALGGLDSGLAVILTNYGLLFVLALPFLGLRAGPLLGLGAAWVLAAPVLSQVVRPELPPRGYDSPSLALLARPAELLSELTFTGYYPVVPWLAYLLVGLGVGRLDLRSPRVAGLLAGGGAALAVVATQVSHALTALPGVGRALLADGAYPVDTPGALLQEIAGGTYGTTPTGGGWQWLLVVAPHSATPFDLAQTTGSALLVVGLCLLLTRTLVDPGRRALVVLTGAGTATLSLYSLHVWLHTPGTWPAEEPEALPQHVLVLLALGALLAAAGLRGPLEAVVRQASLAAAHGVRRARAASRR